MLRTINTALLSKYGFRRLRLPLAASFSCMGTCSRISAIKNVHGMEHAKCLDAFGRLSMQLTRLPNAPWYLLLGNEGVPESGRKVFITRKVNMT